LSEASSSWILSSSISGLHLCRPAAVCKQPPNHPPSNVREIAVHKGKKTICDDILEEKKHNIIFTTLKRKPNDTDARAASPPPPTAATIDDDDVDDLENNDYKKVLKV
jgi:hypothetical protein